MKKLVFTQKQLISTSKRRVEHQFAGPNTQHSIIVKCPGFKTLTPDFDSVHGQNLNGNCIFKLEFEKVNCLN